MSVQELPALRVSIEKSGVILISLPLYVVWFLSFQALIVFLYSLCLVSVYHVVKVLCFLVQFIWFSVKNSLFGFLCLYRYVLLWVGKFSSIILLKIFSVFLG